MVKEKLNNLNNIEDALQLQHKAMVPFHCCFSLLFFYKKFNSIHSIHWIKFNLISTVYLDVLGANIWHDSNVLFHQSKNL